MTLYSICINWEKQIFHYYKMKIVKSTIILPLYFFLISRFVFQVLIYAGKTEPIYTSALCSSASRCAPPNPLLLSYSPASHTNSSSIIVLLGSEFSFLKQDKKYKVIGQVDYIYSLQKNKLML